MEPRLISPCFSVSPASPEHSLYPVSLGVPCDLQPSSTNPQSSSPSDHQPPDSSPSPQNQQVLSSWVGPTGSNNPPNKRKPPQPQPKQPRSPSLLRKNSRGSDLPTAADFYLIYQQQKRSSLPSPPPPSSLPSPSPSPSFSQAS